MIDKEEVLQMLEEKRFMVLKDWALGASRKELNERYGDFALAVIAAQISKMKNESFVLGIWGEKIILLFIKISYYKLRYILIFVEL